MEGQLHRIHVNGVSLKSAGHHNPADGALQGSEQKEDHQRQDHVLSDLPFNDENDKRNEEDNADRARPEPMEPLPEKDEFKVGQGKIHIQQAVLRRSLIIMKFLQPPGMGQWRQHSRYHVPLGDGQS